MNHKTKRSLLLGCGLLSFTSCIASISPRVIAWNDASQGVLIASARSLNCRVLNGSIEPNTIPLDHLTKRPLPSGTHICDWQGNTGQINGSGAIDYLKQGQSESISSTLKSRGFKP